MAVEIRMLHVDDEASLVEAQDDMAREGFPFAFTLDDPAYVFGAPFDAYVANLVAASEGRSVKEGWVPNTFLVAVDGDDIVGRVSIRHALNEFLASEGGHIGYCVRPAHRRRGIATRLLDAGLEVLREVGVSRALVTCDHDNDVSARIIERAGGRFESLVDARDGIPKRRYWIDLDDG
ncbi:MAG TPA: GNAT family N-acetyltransferase [Acidimicrobiales bacterium]|nr:GNAT family N-acetyltransferase [Acidimicrobiales bacterium]